MVNYKPVSSQTVTLNGLKVYIPPNALAQYLYDPTNAGAAPDTFRGYQGSANYQVGSGETLHILAVMVHHTAVTSTLKLYQADTADAITTERMAIVTGTFLGEEIWLCDFTVASDKFLTLDPGSTQINAVHVVGYIINPEI